MYMAHTHTHAHTNTHTRTHTHLCIHTYIHTNISMHALAYVGQQRMRQSVQGQLRHLMCALPKLLVVAVPVCAVCVSVCRHTFREEERKIGRERGMERYATQRERERDERTPRSAKSGEHHRRSGPQPAARPLR